ncbi:MAG: RNA chaperone Hfq [Candidatus Portiera sp.]|nr:RNA chaperone Hfq [Portiera sp.]
MTEEEKFAESLEGKFLEQMREDQLEINIYLVNGIRLKGFIDGFNENVILLRNGSVQMVRFDAISTIMPASTAAETKS